MASRRTLTIAATLLLLTGALVPAGGAQQPQPQHPKRWGDDDLKLERDLVTLGVTVVDPGQRRVTGLAPENFEIYDNKVRQEIAFFGDQDEPATIGIIFDVSGSMKGFLNASLHSLKRFSETSIVEDEYFLVTFDSRARLTRDFTHDVNALANGLTFVEAKGRTALFDAVYIGIVKAREGHNRKRALLVITDGGENDSRYTSKEVKDLVKESDVPIYTFGIHVDFGGEVLDQMSLQSGGRSFYPQSDEDLIDMCIQVAIDLRKQYGIGYYPTGDIHDGKWHEVRVKIVSPPGLPHLVALTKNGYFGLKRRM